MGTPPKVNASAPTAYELEFVELILRPFRAVKRTIKKVLPKPKPKPPAVTVMFDSVTLDQIPPGAPAVAGYAGGYWPTYNELVVKFPKAKHLSIAVNAGEDADCLDVETGDATPDQAPAWVHRQHARKIKRPVVYANLSTMPQVIAALKRGDVARGTVRLWVADYNGKPVKVPDGYDAIQYTDHAYNRNLDMSLLLPTFFD